VLDLLMVAAGVIVLRGCLVDVGVIGAFAITFCEGLGYLVSARGGNRRGHGRMPSFVAGARLAPLQLLIS
jgi:hypothetical protein